MLTMMLWQCGRMLRLDLSMCRCPLIVCEPPPYILPLFRLDDWGSYINAVGELTHHTSGAPDGGSLNLGRAGIPR